MLVKELSLSARLSGYPAASGGVLYSDRDFARASHTAARGDELLYAMVVISRTAVYAGRRGVAGKSGGLFSCQRCQKIIAFL